MPNPTAVGHSDRRTPIKHAYLSRTLGAEIGAARHAAKRLRTAYDRQVLVDLTAGDGMTYHGEGQWAKACSPGIFARHAQFEDCPVPVWVLLCERAAATFDSLVSNLTDQLPTLGYEQVGKCQWQMHGGRVRLEARHGDSRELACRWGKGDFVFLNNDPNKVHDWALPHSLPQAVRRGAIIRSFSTMGCNPGGLKRLPFEGGREAWYDHVATVTRSLRRTQDATLLAIDGDDAQWAYLVVTPRAWVEDDIRRARRIFSQHGMAVKVASYRNEWRQFRELEHLLFLTAKERRPPHAQLW